MNISSPTLLALVLLSVVPACGDDGGTSAADGGGGPDAATSTPSVLSNAPLSGATGVSRNAAVSATFSEPMDTGSLSATTFTMTTGNPAVPVAGSVLYSNSIAFFAPTALFAVDTSYTATITTGTTSASGIPLAQAHSWSFTSGDTIDTGLPVDLGSAASFAILAKAAISTVPTSAITGDIGVSPSAATFITGFSLTADSTNTFSSSPQVTGKVYAADYAVPTPSKMTTAISDMELAFTAASARAPEVTELGAGNIGGQTLEPGVYKWGTGLLVPTDVTLSGSATDVWIFQIAGDLTMSSGAKVVLAGGALAKNVFWQVSGSVDLGTTAHCEGSILTQTSITLRTGASVSGRLLAQTAVDLDGNAVAEPAN